jgi:outer membrane protein assembly factor BamB
MSACPLKIVMLRNFALLAGSFVFAPAVLAQQPGTLRWRIPIGNTASSGWAVSSSPALGPDGTIYIANGSFFDTGLPLAGRKLYSITPDGHTNWVFTTGNNVYASPAVGPDGSIYIGSSDGNLYAVSPAGGTNWLFRTRGSIYSSAAVGADGTVYVTSLSNRVNELYSIRQDGSSNWVFHMGPVAFTSPDSAQFSSPAIGPDGTIYIGSMDTNVYAIHPDGTTNWTYRLGDVTYGSPSVGADGTIYIGCDDYKIRALAPDGHLRWLYPTTSFVESSPVVGNDGRIYVASLDQSTYALTPSGTFLFRVMGFSDSPALAANGTFYLAGPDSGVLRAFDHAGSNRWSFNLGVSSPIFSSPVIGADGTIYIGAGAFLVAVYGDSPPQQAPWSMFRREPLHTARATQRAVSQPTLLPDGMFGMTLGTETGLTYRVQATVDFGSWTDLATFVPTNFTSQFIDFDATNFPSRFYRLATP